MRVLLLMLALACASSRPSGQRPQPKAPSVRPAVPCIVAPVCLVPR